MQRRIQELDRHKRDDSFIGMQGFVLDLQMIYKPAHELALILYGTTGATVVPD